MSCYLPEPLIDNFPFSIFNLKWKQVELLVVLILGLVFSACSKEKLEMPVAHPFPRVGFGDVEKQFRFLMDADSTRSKTVHEHYRKLKYLIRMLLHEGAMVDGVLTRFQGEEIERLLRHGQDEEASRKVREAIGRLREFRESEEFARFKKNIDTELIPRSSIMGEERLKRMWPGNHGR